MQEAYVRAYEHLNQFAGEAKFSTWLTKIAVYEALGRVHRRRRTEDLDSVLDAGLHVMAKATSATRDPERQAYDHELRLVLERAIDALPEIYRSVFMLRTVEGLTVAETAACLDIGAEAVKTRLHLGAVFVAERSPTACGCRDRRSLSVSLVAVRSRGGSGLSKNRSWSVRACAFASADHPGSPCQADPLPSVLAHLSPGVRVADPLSQGRHAP